MSRHQSRPHQDESIKGKTGMESVLDNVIWNALSTRQAGFSIGGDLARRFDPDVSPFAAAKNANDESLAALSDLIGADGDLLTLQRAPFNLPDSVSVTSSATGVQMIRLRDGQCRAIDTEITQLSENDIDHMRTLADLTKPGPFEARTFELGEFWAIKVEGRLAAMAGERLKVPGFTEVSGVCTHPDFQGRGYAAALSTFVADRIAHRGETPFLHAYADNDGAIRLYRRLGFDIRCQMNVAVIERRGTELLNMQTPPLAQR